MQIWGSKFGLKVRKTKHSFHQEAHLPPTCWATSRIIKITFVIRKQHSEDL